MKRTLALGGAVAGMLAAAAVAAPAHAAPTDAAPALNLANTKFAAQQVVQYWIGEAKANLINATPYNVETTLSTRGVQGKAVTSASDKPGVVGSSGDQKVATAKTKNINLPRTVGKVFFTGADGKPHWCTATSIQNGYKNLVVTAGHCVYDTKKDKDTLDNWVFIPGYYQGKTPWGIYVGKTAYVHSDFKVFEDGDRNYAFVTVYNGVLPTSEKPSSAEDLTYKSELFRTKEEAYAHLRKVKAAPSTAYSKLWVREVQQRGKTRYQVVGAKVSVGLKDVGRLGDNVGGQGLAYNQKVGTAVFMFGYPSGSHPDGSYAFSGKTMKWSYGKTFRVAPIASVKGEELIGLKSSFTGEGAIGSPWLYRYSNAKRLGYVTGVTMGVSDTDGNNRIDTSVSSYFDGETLAVYNAAKNNASGKIV